MSDHAAVSTVSRISVNGEVRELEAGMSVAELLAGLGRHPRTVALERNGVIVPRARFDSVVLADGDRLEIIAFTQGG